MDEFNKIIDYNPEIIFLPYPTKTWDGFLIIECPSNSALKERIKINLSAPNYPELTDVELNFGPQICFFNKNNFESRIKQIIKNTTSVCMLFEQIKNFIASVYPFNHSILNNEILTKLDMINQIRDVLSKQQEYFLQSTKNLENLIVTFKNNNLTLKWNSGWQVLSSNLPDSFDFNFKKRKLTLKEIADIFMQYITQMSAVWEQLDEIDEQCHVIDPKSPQPHHLYRRIFLSNSLSILVTLDPVNLMVCPDIKFLGSEVVVQDMKNKLMENLSEWDSNMNIYNNLLKLLNVTEFPHPMNVEKSSELGWFNDNECCICFSLESESGMQPDKICPNIKCARAFHSDCLLQWLQCDGMNKIVFGDIYGKCPHCENSISCSADPKY